MGQNTINRTGSASAVRIDPQQSTAELTKAFESKLDEAARSPKKLSKNDQDEFQKQAKNLFALMFADMQLLSGQDFLNAAEDAYVVMEELRALTIVNSDSGRPRDELVETFVELTKAKALAGLLYAVDTERPGMAAGMKLEAKLGDLEVELYRALAFDNAVTDGAEKNGVIKSARDVVETAQEELKKEKNPQTRQGLASLFIEVFEGISLPGEAPEELQAIFDDAAASFRQEIRSADTFQP